MACTELSSICCAELGSCRLGMGFSGNLWSCLKEVKPIVLFDVECCMAVEPMLGNHPSFRVDWVHRVILHCCDDIRVPLEL